MKIEADLKIQLKIVLHSSKICVIGQTVFEQVTYFLSYLYVTYFQTTLLHMI